MKILNECFNHLLLDKDWFQKAILPIGDEERLDAATISGTVNVTSRMERLTKHYGVSILLSESFYRKIENKSAFNFQYLGKVIVKGKQLPLGIYECFDGDSKEIIRLKQQTLDDFKRGFDYFFDKEFEAARLAFEKVLAVHPQDNVAQKFYRKAQHYLNNPLERSWDGIERMTKK